MDVSKERRRNGASRGNIHARARCLLSCTDTSTISVCRRGNKHSTFAMSTSSANNTRFSVKLTLSALTSSRRVTGAFASDRRRRTERWAGSSPRLLYSARSARELRRLLTRSRGWRSKGQERKESMWSKSSMGMFVDALWPTTSTIAAKGICEVATPLTNPALPPARSPAFNYSCLASLGGTNGGHETMRRETWVLTSAGAQRSAHGAHRRKKKKQRKSLYSVAPHGAHHYALLVFPSSPNRFCYPLRSLLIKNAFTFVTLAGRAAPPRDMYGYISALCVRSIT